MGIEFELKFSATPEQQAAIAGAYPVVYQEFRMETTYYDTADFALSDRHITLRCRMENGQPVCTVKTPTAGIGRGEWECRCDNMNDAVVKLCNQGAPLDLLLLTAEGVGPVCGARFTRQAGIVEYNGTRLELALDAGVLTGGGHEIGLCEVEVELKSGDPADAVAFSKVLSERFGLKPESRSKFRRALALARGD